MFELEISEVPAICIQNDEYLAFKMMDFGIQIDELCIHNDEFCIENDEM